MERFSKTIYNLEWREWPCSDNQADSGMLIPWSPLGFTNPDSDSSSLGRRTINSSLDPLLKSSIHRWMVSYSLSRDSLSSLDVCNHSGGSAQDTAQLQSSVLKALQDGHCKRILGCRLLYKNWKLALVQKQDYKRSGHGQTGHLRTDTLQLVSSSSPGLNLCTNTPCTHLI